MVSLTRVPAHLRRGLRALRRLRPMRVVPATADAGADTRAHHGRNHSGTDRKGHHAVVAVDSHGARLRPLRGRRAQGPRDAKEGANQPLAEAQGRAGIGGGGGSEPSSPVRLRGDAEKPSQQAGIALVEA